MTIDETYSFLKRARELKLDIRKKTDKRDALAASLFPGAIRYDKDRVQTSPEEQVSSVMAEVADMDEELLRMSLQLAEIITETCTAIDLLDGKVEQVILYDS